MIWGRWKWKEVILRYYTFGLLYGLYYWLLFFLLHYYHTLCYEQKLFCFPCSIMSVCDVSRLLHSTNNSFYQENITIIQILWELHQQLQRYLTLDSTDWQKCIYCNAFNRKTFCQFIWVQIIFFIIESWTSVTPSFTWGICTTLNCYYWYIQKYYEMDFTEYIF